MSNAVSTPTGSEIAVIGMSGRFPGAPDLDRFWRNLTQGIESIHRFTDEELARAGEAADLLADPDYVRARPVLTDVDQFDAEFFGFSPQDAAIMDPQHRIFLEVGWEALERAGYDAARFEGQVGVFATSGMNSYMMYHLVTNPRIMRTVGEWLVRHTGNDMSFLATSLSYHLNLKGPSMSVQCACSSALVAIHLAAQSLLSGECDMAMAGGSVVVLPQDRGYLYQSGEIMARDGHCRAFDANATGTLFGSGAGVVVLRRLSDALESGDQILAVMRGSAVNNDGSMKVGFLAPSVEGQSRVIAEALAVSGVDADTVSYIEAHGTGTIVGDPIEVTALTDAFRRQTSRTGFCRIGSLKSNIGHLGEAAGAAAFIKTVLSLQHRQLPPSLNYETPNPQIDFAASPFVVNDRLTAWTSDGTPRRAGITALGAGGTNCHVIVEEAPELPVVPAARAEQIFVLSARTQAALEAARANLADALDRPDAPNLADVAYTLQVGRAVFPHRWSTVATDREGAVRALRSGGAVPQARPGASNVPVAFLFPGGGAQYPNMGRGLYEREPVFRQKVDTCLAVLRARHGIDLGPIWFTSETSIADAARELSRSSLSILSVFILEYALAQLWMSWGVTPASMSGHSLGEYVAACVAGVFSVEDALAIVKARGDVFERLPAGAMLSVLLAEPDIAARLTGRLSLAAVNASTSCVVSGPAEEIAALNERLMADGVETQRVHIDVAAHSPMLEPYLDEFRDRVAAVRLSPPAVPFVSNLTGRWITKEEAIDPGYWVDHLRRTVRFNDGLATLLANPGQVLLEVGPGRALTSLARLQPAKPIGLVTSLRHPTEDLDDVTTVVTALGRLWTMGVQPNWNGLHAGSARRRVPLPAYPFERKRYWVEAGTPVAVDRPVTPSAVATAGRRPDIADWFSVPTWRATGLPDVPAASGDVNLLVFADAAGIAAATVAHLRQSAPGRTWLVEPGPGFARLGDDRFTVNPTSADDYAALLTALGDEAAEITHVAHAWNVGEAAGAPAGFDAELDRAFFGPLALAQALGRQEIDQRLSVTFIASGTVQIAGEGGVVPARATLLGPARVLPRELTNVSTRVVDIVAPASEGAREQRARQLAIELRSTTVDSRVAYRGTARWVEGFERRRITGVDPSSLRSEGVYIITGGMGGIGLEIAAHLAATIKARLVLVGRTPFPPRREWDGWVASHGEHDTTSRRIRRVLECEALGAQVEVATADVADVQQVDAVRRQVLGRFGVIHGIFHTAGTLDDGLMMARTREAALAVLRPKVHGTAAIQKVFADDALDFVALFSSVSSILGLQGQVDYTAANAYLDAVAESASGDTRFVAINWGPWKDVGLAVIAARDRRRAGGPARHAWLDEVRRRADGTIVVGLELARDRQWMLGEHVVRGGDAVLPGTGYLELARAALTEVEEGRAVEISDVLFQSPIVVPTTGTCAVELVLAPSTGGFDCTWQSGDEVFATAHVAHVDAAPPSPLDIGALRSRCADREVAPHGLLDQPFMDFGRRWANIERVNYGHGEALVSLALPAEFHGDTSWCLLHPALLDMATGGAQALVPGFDQANDFYVPISYGRVTVFAGLTPRLYSHVRLAPGTSQDLAVFDVTVTDESGTILVDVDGFTMRRVAATTALAHATRIQPARASALVAPARTPAAAIAGDLLAEGLVVSEGMEALDRALAPTGSARVVVLPGDLAAWRSRVDAAFAAVVRPSGSRRTPRTGGTAGPLANIERELGALWADLLGVESVGDDEDFFELGGHSLIAVRLVNRIEKRFGRKLKLASLFEARTIRDLAQLIRGDKTASSFVSLVAIQPKGALPPLYAVHAIGGEVLSYSELSHRLGADQPFYGFRLPTVDGCLPPLETVEAQAAFYIEELLRHQPEGPYYLTGWSHGGRVAFEMARQLAAADRPVAFVGILDTWATEDFHKGLAYGRDWIVNLPKWLMADLTTTSWSGNANRLQRLVHILTRKLRHLWSPESETHQRWELDDVMAVPEHLRVAGEINLRAFREFKAKHYDGTVTLFRAYAQPLLSPHSRDLEWGRFARAVTVVPQTGNHGSMMTPPHVHVLAERLSAALARTRRAERGTRGAADPDEPALKN